MAKNTILQSLNDSDNVADLNSSNRRQVQTFIAGAAISANDAVALDLSESDDSDKALKVILLDTDASTSQIFVGIALEAAAAAGDNVQVCISGLCEGNVNGSAVANSMLVAGATGGRLAIAHATNNAQLCAICTEADSTNVATVFVLRQGY